jgi:magnesium transporter
MIVARIADTLQNIETDLRGVSRDIFAVDPNRADGGKAKCDLNEVIKLLGRRNALVANLRECLVSIARMLQYFLNNAATWMKGELAAQFRSVARDVKSLDDYTNQQTQEMAFLLDSTLGLISIQQNQIIKIFTVASVLFMPPTLIASIYGMNVDLPVQENPWAFLVVMVAVVMSAILPILYFKKKKLL